MDFFFEGGFTDNAFDYQAEEPYALTTPFPISKYDLTTQQSYQYYDEEEEEHGTYSSYGFIVLTSAEFDSPVEMVEDRKLKIMYEVMCSEDDQDNCKADDDEVNSDFHFFCFWLFNILLFAIYM